MKINMRAFFVAGALCVCGAVAQGAQTPAIDFTSLGGGFDYYQGLSYSLGWYFTANTNIKVTQLGFYDDLKDGLTESHPVGIYDMATQSLVTSAVVTPADPLNGFFHYTPIQPVTLKAGDSYVALAVTGSEKYAIGPPIIVNPSITYGGFACNYGLAPTASLLYPDTFTPGAIGDFGPNFKLSAVPEEGTLQILCGLCVTGTVFLRRYRRR